MQAQAVAHVGAGENMMDQMAMFCVGESTLSGIGQVQPTRRKRLGASD